MLDLSPGIFKIVATCEKAEASEESVLRGSSRTDLILPNHAPRIEAMNAKSAGLASISRTDIGETIVVQAFARDRDGDQVEYLWRTNEANATIGAANQSQQKWSLAPAPGLHTAYLMARDGKGGYAYRKFDMQSNKAQVDFSGTVIDETTNLPIKGAIVTVGGVEARSDLRGWFGLTATPARDERYVLNIRRSGYAMASRVFSRSQTGETYDLIRAQVQKLPADRGVEIADTTSSGPCGTNIDGRPPSIDRRASLRLFDVTPEETARWAAKNRDSARLLTNALRVVDHKCARRGAEISIAPGALVNARGEQAQGEIVASIATLDPARRSLPGNYEAVSRGSEQTRLFSYGSVYAEFRAANGEKLNLANGQSAELRIPVPASQRLSAQSEIALWSYDEDRGSWIEEGTATLKDTPQGAFYVGNTTHFSTINMDIKLSGGTCVRFHVPPGSFSGWTDLRMRAFVTFGGTNSQTFDTSLNGDDMHAFFRLPFGAASAPNTLRFEVNGRFNGQLATLLNDIVNIDALPPNPTSGDIFYPYPFTECGTAIELAPPAGVLPNFGTDASGRPFFLEGPYGDYNPSPAIYNPDDYYTAIDPTSAKATLGAWWQANGFGANGLGAGNPSYTQAGYLNHNDLGFGRDMHCAKNNNGAGPGLACYVTNYGLPDQNPDNANLPVAKRGATVTMEYSGVSTASQRVQFYVFGGGVDTSPRIKYADLDGFGPKPVPQLCTVCHGGNYVASSHLVEGSAFREFDLPSFKYSNNRSWDYGQSVSATTPTAAEFGSFAKLNSMVHDIAPAKISALITAWYPSGFSGNPLPVLPTPPGAWNNNATSQTTYQGPYGKTCRACHIARSFDFASQAALSSTSFRVCGAGRVMPNAIVTYKNFWADTNRVRQFELISKQGTQHIAQDTCKNDTPTFVP